MRGTLSESTLRTAVIGLALALLAVMFGLVRCGEARRSDTSDEPMHLVRGVAYWQQSDTMLSYSHPPLANAVTTAVLLPDIGHTDVTTLHGWARKDPVRLGHSYFRRDFEAARSELSRARGAMTWVALAFATWVFVWCWRRWDPITALVALALVATNPTILAHAGLMTTDLPAAFAGFAAITSFAAWLESRGWVRLALFALAVAVLLATKHSGAPIVVVLSTGAFAWAWLGRGRFAGSPRPRRLGRAALELLVVGLVSIAVVNAAYRFDKTGWTIDEIVAQPEPENWISNEYEHDIIRAPPLLPGSLRVPLPYPYLYGLASIGHQSEIGHRSVFFGMRTRRNPLYFPVMLLLKQPVGVLALLGIAAWQVRRKRVPAATTTWLIVATAIAYVAIASLGKFNVGVRHVLLVFPVMIVIAARMAVIGWRSLADTRWARPVIAGCIATAAIAGPLAVPHTLGWFNVLVGGPAGGNRATIVGEDWGQDVADLGVYLREHDHRRIHYRTSGRPLRALELRRWGVESVPLDCDDAVPAGAIVAAHGTELVRSPECLAWLDACTELTVINHHIHVWRCDEAAGPDH